MYKKYGKRLLDIVVATVLLLLSLPLFLLLYPFLYVIYGGNVFFRQKRPGLYGTPFYIYKLKSMTDCCKEDGTLLPDAERLTVTGKIIRKFSLDELPQLYNVLRGELSIVGPRPLLTEYLPLYTKEQAQRHHVKPGITGWAQVNGRNGISWEQKFSYDIWYVRNLSFKTDLLILFRTAINLLRPKHINAPGQATVAPFTGSRTSSPSLSC
ncbi:sugar transferase [Pontibacter silvestris]|uniref:Sugar transferase n=1 Tax=Pontibacter silvestris TaxID=2305183 RepID=A0ABW4WTE1_9BACT|nr:sugar transferase [Pontibacter silvestris]MCC9136200.1 sugar transferase [Pontibacter silvestris]